MGAIQSLRKNSWMLTIIIGLAMLAFIVTGLDMSFISRSDSITVAKVNGEEFSINEYNEIYNQLEQNSRDRDLSYAAKENLYNQAWEILINRKIYEERTKELGLGVFKENLNQWGVSNEELEEIVYGEHPSPLLLQYFKDPQTNQYDPNAVKNFIDNLDILKEQNPEAYNMWIELEKEIHNNALVEKYNNLVANGIYATSLEAEDHMNNKNNVFDFEYVAIPYNSISDAEITISDEDLAKYYKTICNEKRFEQKGGVTFEYVTFDIKASQEDIAEIENEVKSLEEGLKNCTKPEEEQAFLSLHSNVPYNPSYQKESDLPVSIASFAFNGQIGDIKPTYFEDESYKVSKISDIRLSSDSVFVRYTNIATQPTNEGEYKATLEKIDTLRKSLAINPNFMALSAQFAIDTVINEQWFTENELSNDSCFIGSTGSVYMTDNQDGVILVEVLTQGQKSKRVQVQTLAKPIVYSKATRDSVYKSAVSFNTTVKDLETFEKVANENPTMHIRTVNNSQVEDRFISDIEESREIIKWMHQNKLTGAATPKLFTCGDKYVVAVLKSINVKGPKALDEVSELVTNEYKKEQKKEKLLKEFQSKKYSTLQAFVDNDSTIAIQTANNVSFANSYALGDEPEVIATLATLKEGETSSLIAGNNALYMAQIKSKTIVENTDAKAEQTYIQRMQVQNIKRNIYDILKRNAEIEDNRIKFN